ncbi:UNVERIFIED_CONTAM: EVI5-like protein [Sesamum latifolium]|uniref:EVI5-like protein n=1 Tax=Sesamum latifolium TaxID=2727402 RepID=A0AAW2XLG4_9LAMI
MVGVGGSDWNHYVGRKPHVVKRRIRKGIPDCLRGLVWQLISGSRELLLMNPGVYEGMGFVAGLLLLYMSEEDAFWLLVALLKGAVHAPMEGLYMHAFGSYERVLVVFPKLIVNSKSAFKWFLNILLCSCLVPYASVFILGTEPIHLVQVGLPLVQQYLFQLDQLVKEHLPKLGEHFAKEMINPSMYASQWFITVFSYSFPFHLALRIWDVFLFEGAIIIFKVGLAVLKYCHDDLVKLPFEKLIYALRNFPADAMNPDMLLPMAYSLKVSKSLDESKEEYAKQSKNLPNGSDTSCSHLE